MIKSEIENKYLKNHLSWLREKLPQKLYPILNPLIKLSLTILILNITF
jgi:hypothetical protein